MLVTVCVVASVISVVISETVTVFLPVLIHSTMRWMGCLHIFCRSTSCLLRYVATIFKIAHFEVYNSVVFSIFTRLYNYNYYPMPIIFITPKRNPAPFAATPYFSCSQPLATIKFIFCFYLFAYLGWTFLINHTICGLL